MRLALSAAFVLAAFGWLAQQVAGVGLPLDPGALRHELKLTYCQEQRGKRFYRTERLEDLCTLKVAFFSEYVSKTMNKLTKGIKSTLIEELSVMIQIKCCTFIMFAKKLYCSKGHW